MKPTNLKQIFETCQTADQVFNELWRGQNHDILHGMPDHNRDEFAPALFMAEWRYRYKLLSPFLWKPVKFGRDATLRVSTTSYPVVAGRYLHPESGGYSTARWSVIIQVSGVYLIIQTSDTTKVAYPLWAGTSLDHAKLMLSTATTYFGQYEDFATWCLNPGRRTYMLEET